jgi:stearoyl-CoA desaturase (delta-9 desaturase)
MLPAAQRNGEPAGPRDPEAAARRPAQPGGAQAHLLRLQRRHAVPVMVLPALGAAVLLLFRWQPTPGRIALCASFYLASMLGITVGFHRLLAHGAFQCAAPVRAALAALGCLAAEGPPVFWVASHRRHHDLADQPGDPHSPHAGITGAGDGARRGLRGLLSGLFHAHAGWMLSVPPTDPLRYAPDLLKDRAVTAVNRRYLAIAATGLAVPAAIGLCAWGPIGIVDGLLWGGLGRMFAVQQITWSIISIGHLWGARPWATRDESRNNALLGLLALGEGWHNNHHAAPTSAAHGLRWWQIDVSFWVIKLLGAAGLARAIRVADPARLSARAANGAGDR